MDASVRNTRFVRGPTRVQGTLVCCPAAHHRSSDGAYRRRGGPPWSPPFRRCAKHSAQYTGRSTCGWNGTCASLRHCAQIAINISLGPGPTGDCCCLPYTPALAARPARRKARQLGQRLGSLKPCCAKNCCSSELKMKDVPNSAQVGVLSYIAFHLCPERQCTPTTQEPSLPLPSGACRNWSGRRPRSFVNT